MKKILSLALALALCLGLAVPALAAGKLSTPTDLAWGGEDCSADTMSWRLGENSAGYVRQVIYRNDRIVNDTYGYYEGEFWDDSPISESLSWVLAFEGIPMESGTYYFTVQNVTDWDSTSANNSAVATSPKWTYTAPAAKLAAPSDPVWDFPYCIWKPGKNSMRQESTLMFYYSESKSGEYYSVCSTTGLPTAGDTARTAVGRALEYSGAGYYKFRVINLSDDVTQVQNSAWSAYSEPYYYDGSPIDICEHWNVNQENWKSPTCTEDGYSGDYICADCGEVRDYGYVLPAEGHDIAANGYCWRCGEQLEYHGTLGGGGRLSWTYSTETGELTFDGVIPSGETVLVACYRNGCFAGVKTAAGSSPTVNVGATWDRLRLFWLKNGSWAPQCEAGSLSLER